MHTKWIYAMKYDTEGNIIKSKARLVPQGFRQVFGVNFDETNAPVTTMYTLPVSYTHLTLPTNREV